MTSERLNELIHRAQGFSIMNWDSLVSQIRQIQQLKICVQNFHDEAYEKCLSKIGALKQKMLTEFKSHGLSQEYDEMQEISVTEIYNVAGKLRAETNFRKLKDRNFFVVGNI